MFIYSHPVYPRRSWERLFKQFYNFGVVCNFSAFIIAFSDYVSRVSNTYETYWNSDKFVLKKSILEVMGGCSTSAAFKSGSWTIQTTVTQESAPFMFLAVSSILTGIFVMHGMLTGFDFFAKLMFALNIRNFRYRGLSIKANLIFVLFTLVLSIAVIAAIALSRDMQDFMQNYMDTCSQQFRTKHPNEFVASQHDVDVVFGTKMEWILAAVVVNLFVYFLAMLHLFAYAVKEMNTRITRLKHPWEKGFFCKPNKPLLIQYSAERRKFEEEVMGPDFMAKLQAMEEQKARAALAMQQMQLAGLDPYSPTTGNSAAAVAAMHAPFPTGASDREAGAGYTDDGPHNDGDYPGAFSNGDGGNDGQDGERGHRGGRRRHHRSHRHGKRRDGDDGGGNDGEGDGLNDDDDNDVAAEDLAEADGRRHGGRRPHRSRRHRSRHSRDDARGDGDDGGGDVDPDNIEVVTGPL